MLLKIQRLVLKKVSTNMSGSIELSKIGNYSGEEIYQTFESVSLKDKTTEPTAGGSVTSFRFNLSDGTSYEVIYSEVAVKAGRVITTGMEQDFFTSADIGAFWGSYDYEVTTASEDELPALYE